MKNSMYVAAGLCLGFLGGALLFSISEIEKRREIMSELKVPSFLKRGEKLSESIGREIFNMKLSAEENVTHSYTAEPNQIDLYSGNDNDDNLHMDWEEGTFETVGYIEKPLTEPEKKALRDYIRGMDKQQMEIILEEIPMELIIAHFGKKWSEAEKFKQSIAMAMNFGK